MKRSHQPHVSHRSRQLFLGGLFLLAPLLVISQAKTPPSPNLDREINRGISLYKAGDLQNSIQVLRSVNTQLETVAGLHYLALALEQSGSTDEGRKTHEKAAKLGESLVVRGLSFAKTAQTYAFLSATQLEIEDAVDSAERYVKLSPKLSKSTLRQWRERIDLLKDLAAAGSKRDSGPWGAYGVNEVTTRAKILSKPEPQYTEVARTHGVVGGVVLRGILAFDGTVRGLVPLQSLPDGLTENCMRVARQIKFIPATRDGKPVSQFIEIKYNLYLY